MTDNAFFGLIEDMATDGHAKKASEILNVQIRCLRELFEGDRAFDRDLWGDLIAVDVLEAKEKQLLVQSSDGGKQVLPRLVKGANLARAAKQKPKWTQE